MKLEPTNKNSRAFFDTLTIATFVALLWLPTLDFVLKVDDPQWSVENRAPAPWPQFAGIAQSRDFIAGVENYFNDHFGFRKRLVRWSNLWKGQLFNEPSGENVLIGRDGWLYYSGNWMWEHWTRTSTFTESDLADWRRLLEMRRDWLAKRGIKYIFVVPPDKQTIYPEHLPEWMKPSPAPSKIQQLTTYMQAHSTVEVLDLGPALIEAKKIRSTYLNTDTHWNQFGGFTGYRAVIQALARQIPGLAPLPADAFEWKPMTRPTGDLAAMMGREDAYKEIEGLTPVASKPLPEPKVIYDPVRLPHPKTRGGWPFLTLNESATGKAMIFRDSYAETWYPLLGQHFREVIYIQHRDWDRPLIERERPDVVIDEILERFMNVENPVELAAKDPLSETSPAIASSITK